ncbi:hypothetical protein D3C76_1392110 [compost metagenome]
MIDNGVPSSSSVMPSTPFMGVRISWLILARNSALALISASLAASARLALKRSSLMRRRRSLTARLSNSPLATVRPMSTHSSQGVEVRVRPSRAGSNTRPPRL